MKLGDLVKVNGAILVSDGCIGIVVKAYPKSDLYVGVFFPDTGKVQYFHRGTLEVISEGG